MLIYYLLLFSLCYSSEIFGKYYKEAEKILQNLSMEERIGQMFFPRFILDNCTDDIKNRRPDGFVLFGYDFKYDEKCIQNYIKRNSKIINEKRR